MRLAIIDLGTNTFNLLIVETGKRREYSILFEKKLPVKLGKGGIHNKTLQPDAIERAEKALDTHFQSTKAFNVHNIYAFGTSALRGATNTDEFLNRMKSRFPYEITLIDGDREAELIYKGVRQTVELGTGHWLILDIGGGSNEFIICNGEGIFWKQSFDLGIARLLELFQPSDPITTDELEVINRYFYKELQPLFGETQKFQIKRMIGASGTFDTIVSMIMAETEGEAKIGESHKIEMEAFYNLYRKLIRSTFYERSQMPGLEAMKIEMIVLAVHFVKFMLESLNIEHLTQSSFSLKEGAVFELINRE